MDLLDRLLGHDRWTTRVLIARCRGLPDEALDREFDIGHRTVRATLDHIVFNTEMWADLMSGRIEPGKARSPRDCSIPGLVVRLDDAAERLAVIARDIRDRHRWDDRWVDVLDTPPTEKTYGGAIAHVISHSMHHRAQLLYMLRRLGVRDLPEGDVLSWEHRTSE